MAYGRSLLVDLVLKAVARAPEPCASLARLRGAGTCVSASAVPGGCIPRKWPSATLKNTRPTAIRKSYLTTCKGPGANITRTLGFCVGSWSCWLSQVTIRVGPSALHFRPWTQVHDALEGRVHSRPGPEL